MPLLIFCLKALEINKQAEYESPFLLKFLRKKKHFKVILDVLANLSEELIEEKVRIRHSECLVKLFELMWEHPRVKNSWVIVLYKQILHSRVYQVYRLLEKEHYQLHNFARC